MLPDPEIVLQAAGPRLHRWISGVAGSSVALALAIMALPANAQEAPVPPGESALPPASPAKPALNVSDLSGPIAFEADEVAYAYDNEVVTATGNVVLRREDQSVRADKVTWDRNTGKILATGNIRLVDADGNQLFTDQVELTDKLKAGAMSNLLLALRDGGRLAAMTGERDASGKIILTRAAYSGCAVEDDDGCPKQPTWQINATRVVFDPDRKEIKFKGARLRIFGVNLMPLPGLTLASDGRPINGLLIPNFQLSASNGLQISDTWYQRLADNQDLSLTGYLFTKTTPMVSAKYRALFDTGALQITGYATHSKLISVSGSNTSTSRQNQFRGYLFANGKFQFSPEWSLTSSIRVASDRTFLKRYDISYDDRLRSTVNLERVGDNSYFSIAGWATQTLRVGDSQGQVPIALPVIDWRRRFNESILGGKIQLQLNSLALTRTNGQDTQRAFAGAQWDLTRITPLGQEITFTALARGDVYHSDQNGLTATALYRGNPGWQGRTMAIGAVDVKWPLVGEFFGGTQVLTPRVEVVASPAIRNLAVPNEDARAIDLEDSNLFALNRFPGYDRVEDGVRFTYGFDWQWRRPNWQVFTTIGQSYRLSNQVTIVPDGTGLASKVSDIVGRTEVRFKDRVKFTHRFRLDKQSLAVRRNEFDATLGSERTYVEAGYLRLNRNITQLEDLQDREELRLAGRVGFAKYWSMFGSGVFDLTKGTPSALSNNDGFQPLRTRVGAAYEDDCILLALTWQRTYISTGDAVRGNSVQVSFALRNLGSR